MARRIRKLEKISCYIFLSVVGVTMVLPFLWMLSTALKQESEVFASYPQWWKNWIPGRGIQYIEESGQKIEVRKVLEEKGKIKVRITDVGPLEGQERLISPNEFHEEWHPHLEWANFKKAWESVSLGRGYVNSLLVALLLTFGQVLTSSLAAFAFARLEFPGRDKLFFAYLATMMIPGAVTMIPVFILLVYLPEGLNIITGTDYWTSTFLFLHKYFVARPIGIDSYFAIITPGLFSAYGTFLLRQFFMTIPRDLEDAARIDGCSRFGIYWNVILPLAKPAIVTLVIFTFLGSWRSFMWPLIVTQSAEIKTLPILLASFQDLHETEWTLLMAASLEVLIPVIAVFVISQRFFVEGIRLGAIKG